MNIPEMNHQQKRTQNALPVQRWQRMANFFSCVRKCLMPKQGSILLRQTIDRELPHLMRFVPAAIDGEFRGQGYAQDKWVETHGYGDMEWRDLVDLWYHYNALLVHLAGRIPDTQMDNPCVIGLGVQTLGFVMEDYVIHMQHHLDHILARDPVTPYATATGFEIRVQTTHP